MAVNVLWIFVTSAMVFMMQPGFALLEAGAVARKNVVNIMLKNLADISIVVLIFSTVGFSLMFAEGGQIWASLGFDTIARLPQFANVDLPAVAIKLFYVGFAATAVTIISGSVAGRITFASYICISAFMAMIVFPLLSRQVWGPGIFARLGLLDFAGGITVHGLGGAAALAAAKALGPRIECVLPDGRLRSIDGDSPGQGVLGAFLLWFGWFGFNAGSILELEKHYVLAMKIMANTFLGGAVGLMSAVLLASARRRPLRPAYVIDSVLAGLASCTASCAFLSPAATCLVSAIGGLSVPATKALVRRLRIDDAVDAFAIHAVPGLWGACSISLLAPAELVGDRLQHLAVQAGGGLAVATSAFILVYGFCRILDHFVPLRIAREMEIVGADYAIHGFQPPHVSSATSHEQRLQDQGRALAALGHDVMGSIAAARLQSELATQQLEGAGGKTVDLKFLKDRVTQTMSSIKRAEEIGKAILSYSKKEATVCSEVSIADALDEAAALVKATHGTPSLTIDMKTHGNTTVLASRPRLVQAFYNILRNCAEAYGDGAPQRLIDIRTVESKDRLLVAIEDFAGGMSDEQAATLGEEFTTGKPQRGGTGLGMFLTKSYLREVGMTLDVHNRPGLGATFLISLPHRLARIS